MLGAGGCARHQGPQLSASAVLVPAPTLRNWLPFQIHLPPIGAGFTASRALARAAAPAASRTCCLRCRTGPAWRTMRAGTSGAPASKLGLAAGWCMRVGVVQGSRRRVEHRCDGFQCLLQPAVGCTQAVAIAAWQRHSTAALLAERCRQRLCLCHPHTAGRTHSLCTGRLPSQLPLLHGPGARPRPRRARRRMLLPPPQAASAWCRPAQPRPPRRQRWPRGRGRTRCLSLPLAQAAARWRPQRPSRLPFCSSSQRPARLCRRWASSRRQTCPLSLPPSLPSAGHCLLHWQRRRQWQQRQRLQRQRTMTWTAC